MTVEELIKELQKQEPTNKVFILGDYKDSMEGWMGFENDEFRSVKKSDWRNVVEITIGEIF
jgi:hypothetical protein